MKQKKVATKPDGGNFEQSLKRLEEIVEALEEGSVTLEEVLQMYQEGAQLSKQCLEQLHQAELTLKRLSKDINGKFELVDEEPRA